MKKITLLLMMCMGILGMNAQQLFSLEQAIAFALENNKALKTSRMDVLKSEGKYKETRAGWMPQVEGTVDFMTYFGYEMEFDLMGGGFTDFTPTDYQQAALAGAAAASDPGIVAMGGSGSFDVSQYAGGAAYEGYLQSTLPPTTIDMGASSTAKLQVGQLLFNGQLLVGIRSAKLGMEMAQKSVESSELQTRSAVTNAYYSALVMDETLTILDQTVEEMESLVEKTEMLYKVGMAEQTDYDQLVVQLNTVKNSRMAMERMVDVTYNLLRFQLGLAVGDPVALTDDLPQIIGQVSAETVLAQAFDIANNLDYQLMEKQVELSEEMVNMDKMSYAPTLSAFYAYNAKILTSGFDMTPNNVAGATLTVPIFSGLSKKHKVDQSKVVLLQAENNKAMVRDQLMMQESQLRSDFVSKFEEYELQKENVAVAKRVYESYERKFTQGTASAMDLTQANNSYLQAESSHLTSMLSVLQARVALLSLLNSL